MCINRHRQAGISFIELIMFIVIVSVGVVGVLSVMNVTTAHSSDPLPRKQALAIAESLLEEIELQPFTWCDPDDQPAVTMATQAANCLVQEAAGGEGVESRYSNAAPFDNVNDYHGFSMTGIKPIEGDGSTDIPGLSTYSANVTVVAISAIEAAALGVPASAVLQITVRVTGPAGTDITLTGYRFRYAPTTA